MAMPISLDFSTQLKCAVVAAGFCILAGCGMPQPQTASAPPGPIAAGQARIWFYRVYDPSLSRNIANVDLNGVRAISVAPADPPAFRDVASGPYHIAPETTGTDVNQARDVNLAPGQTIYVKILDDPSWISGGSVTAYQRDTFYTWVMPAAAAQAEMNTRRM
jgi:hypothetical protein